MIVVLVGSPLAGKTTFLKELQKKGLKVFHTDSYINSIYKKDQKGYEIIRDNISSDFVNDKEVDKRKLAIWCADEENLKKLNELIHPLIKEYLEGKDDFVCELPIISTSSTQFKYDKVVLVKANDEEIKERFKNNKINNPDFIKKIISSWKNTDGFEYVVDTTKGIQKKDINKIMSFFK